MVKISNRQFFLESENRICSLFVIESDMSSEPEVEEKTGVKLPYFHRVLSPEDQALIGDIAPKPIATTEVNSTSSSSRLSSAAWNSANTWEERDCTAWAKKTLLELFNAKIVLPKTNQYTVTLKPVKDFNGNSQVTHIRGKARFIYEFAFDVSFTVTSEANAATKFKGKLNIADLINDQLDDMEVALTWTTGSAPTGAELIAVRNTILNGKGLKNAVKEKFKEFEVEFSKL